MVSGHAMDIVASPFQNAIGTGMTTGISLAGFVVAQIPNQYG